MKKIIFLFTFSIFLVSSIYALDISTTITPIDDGIELVFIPPWQTAINALWDEIFNLKDQIASLFTKTDDLQQQVDNIELTPGPQGEPGPTKALETMSVLRADGGTIVCCPEGWVRTGCNAAEYYILSPIIPAENECCKYLGNNNNPMYAICLKYAD